MEVYFSTLSSAYASIFAVSEDRSLLSRTSSVSVAERLMRLLSSQIKEGAFVSFSFIRERRSESRSSRSRRTAGISWEDVPLSRETEE